MKAPVVHTAKLENGPVLRNRGALLSLALISLIIVLLITNWSGNLS